MKSALLTLIAESPGICATDIQQKLGMSYTRTANLLAEVSRSGEITCKFAAHGKRLWSIAEAKPDIKVEPYVVEKTMHLVREITSIFSYQ